MPGDPVLPAGWDSADADNAYAGSEA
jgi:hypothetical protein